MNSTSYENLKLKEGQYVRINLWGKYEGIIDQISSKLNGYILYETDLTGLDDKQVSPVKLEQEYKHEYEMDGNPVGISVRGPRQEERAEFLMNNLPWNCLYKSTSQANRMDAGILWVSNRNVQMPETFASRIEHYIKRGTKCPLYEVGSPRNLSVTIVKH